MKEFVKLTVDNAIGTIEFFHPQSNALPGNILKELAHTIETAGQDNNIKVILGHQKQNERLEIFVRSFEKLKKYKKIRTRGIFDMRYPNGFALSYSPL